VEWSIVEEPASCLAEYGRVPIAFRVDRRLEVIPVDAGLGGILLRERTVDPPYIKDYDAIEGNDLVCSDVNNWGIFSAFRQGRRVGGALVVAGTEGLEMLENRADLAVLWDLRVDHDQRRQGLGRALFAAAEGWARARGCRWLKVETQNINVPACRFYAGQGCILGGSTDTPMSSCRTRFSSSGTRISVRRRVERETAPGMVPGAVVKSCSDQVISSSCLPGAGRHRRA
jgi:GNAT superfamily N-acetyltransferase